MSNVVFCKYLGSWKGSNPGVLRGILTRVLKGVKLYLFGDNFCTAGGRELKFCRMVRAYCRQLLAKFQIAVTNSLRVVTVFVIWKFWFRFAHAWCQWSLGPPGLILVVKFEFQQLMHFWWEISQWHSKTLDLFQKYSGLERNLFCNDWDKLSLFLINLISKSWVVKQWMWMSSMSSTALPHMTFVCKISVFTCKLWANLNWLFVLGHSLLRPTSNNLKKMYSLRSLGVWFLSVQSPLLDSWLLFLLGFES